MKSAPTEFRRRLERNRMPLFRLENRKLSKNMEWKVATARNAVILLVLVGLTPTESYRISNGVIRENLPRSSASTAEVFRKVQRILSITRRLGKLKVAKQEEAATDGAANALATLTDSFGGQLAGQIVSVILSSVTGDVRGILGNSLNLFQTDDRRDMVQGFLDELSQNFLKFTGLAQLTTTKPPQQGQLQQGQPILVGPGSGLQGGGVGGVGGAGVGGLGGVGGVGGVGGLAAGTGGGAHTSGTAVNQQGQQQQSPIIYVLPQLNGNNEGGAGGTSGVGGTGVKTNTGSGNRVTNTDDDSEEDR